MNRQEVLLAGLSAGKGAFHTPVQVQKLFFLLDRNIATEIDGPHFDFQPYNYGPFDKEVYDTLEALETEGLVEISRGHRWNHYRLTAPGQEAGEDALARLSPAAQKYVRDLSATIRSLSFSQLVRAVYKAYPDMRRNSVFQE